MLIDTTFELYTEESIDADGQAEDQGFEAQDEEFSFRELVDKIKENHWQASGEVDEFYPDHVWITTTRPLEDTEHYQKGHDKYFALHFSRKNKPRHRKYWAKAIRYCQKEGSVNRA